MRGMVERGSNEWYVREKEKEMNVQHINLLLLYYLPFTKLNSKKLIPVTNDFLKQKEWRREQRMNMKLLTVKMKEG